MCLSVPGAGCFWLIPSSGCNLFQRKQTQQQPFLKSMHPSIVTGEILYDDRALPNLAFLSQAEGTSNARAMIHMIKQARALRRSHLWRSCSSSFQWGSPQAVPSSIWSTKSYAVVDQAPGLPWLRETFSFSHCKHEETPREEAADPPHFLSSSPAPEQHKEGTEDLHWELVEGPVPQANLESEKRSGMNGNAAPGLWAAQQCEQALDEGRRRRTRRREGLALSYCAQV